MRRMNWQGIELERRIRKFGKATPLSDIPQRMSDDVERRGKTRSQETTNFTGSGAALDALLAKERRYEEELLKLERKIAEWARLVSSEEKARAVSEKLPNKSRIFVSLLMKRIAREEGKAAQALEMLAKKLRAKALSRSKRNLSGRA